MLGQNGIQFQVMLYSLPVLPLGVIAFIWYILIGEPTTIPIIIFVVFVSLVLLHQEIEVIRFIRVAALTVKKLVVSEDGHLIIYLFSNKTLTLSEFTVSKDVPDALNHNIYRRLFPKEKENGTISLSEGEYYLTGTIDGIEDLYQKLEESKGATVDLSASQMK